MPHPGGDRDPIALDLHPTAPAVSQLAAGEIAVERLALQRQAGRHPLDDAGEAGAVGLPRGGQLERHLAQG